VRDYQLPRNFSEKSGGIFISFSGNTEETISSLEEALNKGFKNLLVMATGGQLLEIATINHLPYVQIPNDCLQPRMGYGYFIGGLLKVLHLSGLLPDLKAELDHTVQTLTAMNEEIQTIAQNLATKLEKQIPVVYAPDGWKYLAMVVKINFNENTKIQSFWNFFPELNHNEMIGYSNLLGNYHLIIFDDPGAHPRIRKRLNVFTDLMKDKLPITTISMLTTGPITKLFHSLLIGLWTSYFLALKLETDPTPVAMVEEFKKRLNQ
jgi:glucose/mannose-6-phosphate isomerase